MPARNCTKSSPRKDDQGTQKNKNEPTCGSRPTCRNFVRNTSRTLQNIGYINFPRRQLLSILNEDSLDF